MEAAAAVFSAFRAQVGDDRSSLIDPDEQASLAEVLLEVARERRALAVALPLELLHGSGAAGTIGRRAAAHAGRYRS